MGQAALDLPDPLESSLPAQAQSADDLLSQLAGDEIDRLLAESEGEPAPPAKVPPSSQSESAIPAAAELVGNTAALPGESMPDESASDELPSSNPSSAKSGPQVSETVESVDLDAVLDTAVAESAERSALHGNAPPVITGPLDNSPQIELGDGAKRVPLILRPLEWLSSPLDPWPDQLREILGKIGLMTLINALAVLAYVLLVRRHHH